MITTGAVWPQAGVSAAIRLTGPGMVAVREEALPAAADGATSLINGVVTAAVRIYGAASARAVLTDRPILHVMILQPEAQQISAGTMLLSGRR